MFIQRCRLLIKRIYNSFVMFNQDQIAAAQIAQIFGSELLKVQNSARTDSGHTPNIVNMDPKSFLVGKEVMSNQRKSEERRLIEMLQREAEAACPLPLEQTFTPPVEIPKSEPVPYPQQIVSGILPPQLVSANGGGGSSSPQLIAPIPLQQNLLLERIANSLERIANAVDKVEIKSKKKTVKRNTNKTKISKPILLNETTA